jgi:putative glutamine amidotransferase
MPHLATWIRATDEENFARFFSPHPDLRVSNARLAPIDPDAIDGVLLTGGPDVAAEFHPEMPCDLSLIRDAQPERDAWEIEAARFAVERGLPLLCICKGVQVLNLALGGSLLLDIPGHDLPEMKLQNLQPLRFDTGARHRFAQVNSSHHQALDRVADRLIVEAWHAGDGIVEQVRVTDHPWGLGVQYHPERHESYTALFEDFFAQLRA